MSKVRMQVTAGSQVYRLRDEAQRAGVPHGATVLATIHNVGVSQAGTVYFCNISGVTLHGLICGEPDRRPLPCEAHIIGEAQTGHHDMHVIMSVNGKFALGVIKSPKPLKELASIRR